MAARKKVFCAYRLWAAVVALSLATALLEARADNPSDGVRTFDGQMSYIEFRFVSPSITRDSVEGSTRKIWRSGARYMRLQEAPDPQRHLHELVIINEPDVWMLNLIDNVAKHIVDPGPTYNAHFPVFQNESKRLTGLEFGREQEFFAASDAHPSPDEVIDGVNCSVQTLDLESSTVRLYLRRSTGLPFQVSIVNARHAYAVRYDRYEPRLPLEPALFMAPVGAKIVEGK